MERDPLKQRKNLYRWAKRRAAEQRVCFSITVDDIQIPKKCPVLKIPIYSGDGVSIDNSPTLDRIVPEVGYVPGNVIVISNRANQIKSNATWHELRCLVEFYEEHISQVWMKPSEPQGNPSNPSIH